MGSNREILAGLFITLSGAGIAIMTEVGTSLFPGHAETIFYSGLGILLTGVAGILWLLVTKRAQSDVRPVAESVPASTTFNIEGGSGITLEGNYSSAERLAHVRDVEGLSSRYNVHQPAKKD
jgi:hypothetical protein